MGGTSAFTTALTTNVILAAGLFVVFCFLRSRKQNEWSVALSHSLNPGANPIRGLPVANPRSNLLPRYVGAGGQGAEIRRVFPPGEGGRAVVDGARSVAV